MAATSYLDLQSIEAYLGPGPVLTNLSLKLQLGEQTVILEPNGSGKSSLIKLLSREIYPVVKPGSWLRLFGEERVNLWDLSALFGTPLRVIEADGYRQVLPAAPPG